MERKPVYEHIIDYLNSHKVKEGDLCSLGSDFHLPRKETGKIPFADGAMDGISIYHMGPPDITEAAAGIGLASAGNYGEADEIFESFCNRIRVVNFIDELQRYIIDHVKELG